MEHKTQDELAEILREAAAKVEVVEQVAILEATNEPAVIYRAEYDKRLLFIRPLSVWLENVEWQGVVISRFQKV